MPIRVQCRCGQTLSVPDAMAGKSGKCPKCAEIIRIPAASSSGSTKPAGATKAPVQPVKPTKSPNPTASQPKSPPVGGALDQLFADAGLGKKAGPECPSCKAPIDPTATLCVRCGFHLASGQKIRGVEIFEPDAPDAAVNRQLKEAKQSLKKEYDADEAAKFTGSPWWVALAVVLGVMTIIAFGVTLVEGWSRNADGDLVQAAETTLKGKVQRLPVPNAFMVIGAMVSSMVVVMAWIATTAAAFKDKVSQGILCFAIPFYAHYYAIKERKKMGGTMRIFVGWSVVWIGLLIGLFTTGTIQYLSK